MPTDSFFISPNLILRRCSPLYKSSPTPYKAAMENITVTGQLCDFKGSPLAGGDVRFYDENFEILHSTQTDANGNFEISVANRSYPSVFICQSYKDKFLEYWHWNFTPKANDHLNIRIDGLELYGMKAWEMAPTYPGMMIFFRPMSLEKFKALGSPAKDQPVLIAPELAISDITVELDGKKAQVIGVNKVREYTTPQSYLDAYLINVSTEGFGKVKRVLVSIEDQQTQEKGMARIDLF